MSNKIAYKNKKAFYKYEFIDTLTAGIVLTGTEIKSIREGKVNFADAFCVFRKSEMWVTGIHIAEYSMGTCNNHVPTRERKLLLNRREIKKLQKKVTEKGLTIVPFQIFIDERGFAKLDIALAKGKKIFDKREDMKKKDSNRDIERTNKY